MAHYKNKEDMFNPRAEHMDRESDNYAQRGNTEKSEWATEQAEHNRSQAEKYKGEEGW